MLMVLWSVDTRDDEHAGRQTDRAQGAAPRPARRRSSSCTTGAATGRRPSQALPAIVRGLRSRGYRLVTVPRMMLRDPPRT